MYPRHLATILFLAAVVAFAGCGKDDNNGPAPADDTGADTASRDGGVDASRDVNGTDVTTPDDQGLVDTGRIDHGVADQAPDAGPDSLTTEEYWDGLLGALCEAAHECPNVKTLALYTYVGRFEDAVTCKQSDRTREILRRTLGPYSIDDSLADGHIVFDGEKAAECISELKAWWCDASAPTQPQVCREVFTGVQEEGDPCRSQECADGLRCDTGAECYGTCVVRSSACDPCGDGEYCDSSTGDCEPRNGEGSPCEFDGACVDGLFCDAPGLGVGTCIQPGSRDEGDACFQSMACGDGLVCQSNVCEPYFFVGRGFACGDLPAIQVCEPGLRCDVPAGETVGTCQPLLGPGETCDNPVECHPDLTCDSVANTCVEPRPFGATCDRGYECESLACDSMTDQCIPLPTCEFP